MFLRTVGDYIPDLSEFPYLSVSVFAVEVDLLVDDRPVHLMGML